MTKTANVYNNKYSISNTDNKPYINADKNVPTAIPADETNDNPQASIAPQNNQLPANKKQCHVI